MNSKLYLFILSVFFSISAVLTLTRRIQQQRAPKAESLSTEELDRAVQLACNDPKKFRAVFREVYPKMVAYFRIRIKSADDAEDLTSECFTRIVDHLNDFNPAKGSFLAWAFSIAHNQLVDFYKKQSRHGKQVPIEDHDYLAAADLLPDEAAAHREDMEKVLKAVNELSEQQRQVIEYRYFLNFRNKEIAEMLDIEEKTVAAYLSRGIERLSNILKAG